MVKMNKNLSDMYRKDVITDSSVMKKYICWFDSLKVNPLLSYFTLEDIETIHKLAISPAMNCNVKEKYRLLGELMNRRGFKLIGGGTNRRAYECIYDDRIVAKVATDQVGFTSNLREYVNQNVLKPFCNKIFEVTPCGSLSIIEKVIPVKDVSEFQKYSGEIYDILYFKIRNNSIAMDDIGTRSFKNWGYRSGFGPVLLDYPTMYVADPKKRLCKDRLNGRLCCGTLDYDEGFNRIVCSECGRTYFAKELALPEGDEIKSLLSAVGYTKKEGTGVRSMKFDIVNVSDGKVVRSVNCGGNSNHVDPTIIAGTTFSNSRKPVVKKKKRFTVSIVSVNDTTVEETIIKPQDSAEKKESESKVVNVEPVTTTTIEEVSLPLWEKMVNKFNENNSCVDLHNVDGRTIDTVELAKRINESMTVHENPFVSREESLCLFKALSTVSFQDDNGKINEYNMEASNTSLNEMLRTISGHESDDKSVKTFDVFFKLINNVKNTKAFFNSILSFFDSVVEIASFVNTELPEGKVYSVQADIFDIYRKTVQKAMVDYKYNIVFNAGANYNLSNVLAIINFAFTRIKYLFEDESEDAMNLLNPDNFYFITLTNDSAEYSKIEAINEVEVIPPVSPVEVYESAVQGNEKECTKRQRNRFGKKNKKNRHH